MARVLKAFIKPLTPPLLLEGLKKLREPKRKEPPKDALFAGEDELFVRVMSTAKSYAEYGCGASTIWVARNTNAQIYGVDSSREWIDFVRQNIGNREAVLRWVDCGTLGKWGTPLTYEKRHNFSVYFNCVWLDRVNPDTILIDGRFRVSCFLSALKHAAEGTRIIFDDYVNRPHYHIIEEVVPRTETYGRQCLFTVPSKNTLDSALLEKLIDKFEYVMG